MPALPVCAETVVDELLARYDRITNVSCEVRKEISGPQGKVRMLSRVHWQRPDRIHVENFSPMKRRYVADGERIFYYVEGDPKGFSRPVSELDRDWVISLRKVPGSPMDVLLLVKDAEETALKSTEEYAMRKGYATENAFAVLSLDEQQRLVHAEVYRSAEMKYRTAEYEYLQYEEVLPGVELPRLHKINVSVEGVERDEETRFTNVKVNEPIPERLFVPGPFFRDIEFVDEFEAIYK